eukprot:scaffold146575_cov40-Prasinocladus_malaysianus.AAC.2
MAFQRTFVRLGQTRSGHEHRVLNSRDESKTTHFVVHPLCPIATTRLQERISRENLMSGSDRRRPAEPYKNYRMTENSELSFVR